MPIEYKQVPSRYADVDSTSITNTVKHYPELVKKKNEAAGYAIPGATGVAGMSSREYDKYMADLAYDRSKEQNDVNYQRQLATSDLAYNRARAESRYSVDDAYDARQQSIDQKALQYEFANELYKRSMDAMRNVPMPQWMQQNAQRDVRAGIPPSVAAMYAGTGGLVNPITGKILDGLKEQSQHIDYMNSLGLYAGGYNYAAMNNAYKDAFGMGSTNPAVGGYYQTYGSGPSGYYNPPTPYYVSQSSYNGGGYTAPSYSSTPSYSTLPSSVMGYSLSSGSTSTSSKPTSVATIRKY